MQFWRHLPFFVQDFSISSPVLSRGRTQLVSGKHCLGTCFDSNVKLPWLAPQRRSFSFSSHSHAYTLRLPPLKFWLCAQFYLKHEIWYTHIHKHVCYILNSCISDMVTWYVNSHCHEKGCSSGVPQITPTNQICFCKGYFGLGHDLLQWVGFLLTIFLESCWLWR